MLEVFIEKTCPEWWDEEPIEERDFFQSSLWGKYLEMSRGKQPFYIYAMRDGKIIGTLLAYYHGLRLKSWDEGGGIIANAPSIRWHQGPLLKEVDDLETAKALIAAAMKTKRIKLKIKGEAPYIYQPEVGDLYPRIADELGLKCYKWATYLIDVSKSIDDLWNGIRGKERTTIRKLLKEGVEVKLLGGDDIKHYHELLREYRKSAHLPLPPLFPDKNLLDVLGVDGLKLLSAYKKGELQSVCPTMYYRGIVRYFAAARNPHLSGSDRSIDDILHWEIIKNASLSGMRIYDNAGVAPEPKNEKERGIKFFKAKWGGVYTEYFVVER